MMFRLNNLHSLQTKINSSIFSRSFRQFQPARQEASKKTDLKTEGTTSQLGNQSENVHPSMNASKIKNNTIKIFILLYGNRKNY